MRTDDINFGENMGDWTDQKSHNGAATEKRYSNVGQRTLMGKPPVSKRRIGAPLSLGPMQDQRINLMNNGNMIMSQGQGQHYTPAPNSRSIHDGLNNRDIEGSYIQQRKPRINYNAMDYSDVYQKQIFTGSGAATKGRVNHQVYGQRGQQGQ